MQICRSGHNTESSLAGLDGATADFDLVHLRDGQEIRRERWSLTLRFEFLRSIPSELVVHNPMGILITYLQADRALVTEQPR